MFTLSYVRKMTLVTYNGNMSNTEAADSLPVSDGEFISFRIQMEGPKDRPVPIELEAKVVDGKTSLSIHGPFNERNLIGESAYEKRQVVVQRIARVAFWDRARRQRIEQQGSSRRYRGVTI
jgi:hypothetical protein